MLKSIGKLSKQEVWSLKGDLKQNMSALVPSLFDLISLSKAADMKLTQVLSHHLLNITLLSQDTESGLCPKMLLSHVDVLLDLLSDFVER